MVPYQAPVRRRRARRRSSRVVTRRRVAIAAFLAAGLLVVFLVAAFGSSPSSYQPALASGEGATASAGPPQPQVVAVQRDLRLQLPVPQQSLTAIGYHGADEGALPLDPVGRQANEGLFSRLFHNIFGGGEGGLTYYQLSGGEGPSTGAVDVGAVAGTDVYAPVDGTVVSIVDYVVNGQPYGHVIGIQPSGEPSVVVSLSHLRADPSLTVGSPVSSAASRIGVVLDFSALEQQALARHTRDGGNHVTIAVHPAASISLR